MKVLHLTTELSPIAKIGGLADAVAGMVKYSRQAGIDARVVVPEYGFLKKVQSSKFKVQNYKSKGKINKAPVYLLEHKKYFGKCQGVYGCFKDEREVLRFAWFCQKVVEISLGKGWGRAGWQPEILHCHDWPSALTPLALKREMTRKLTRKNAKNHLGGERIRTVLTIHNFAYQGRASAGGVEKVIGPIGLIRTCPLGRTLIAAQLGRIGERGQKINFLAEGIKYADFVNTVSPTHAKEILRGEMGDGLVRLLREKKRKFVGILNGIEVDKSFKTYRTYKTYMTWKEKQKRRLQKEIGLGVNPGSPVFGFVGRLVKQKGIELLINAEKREISPALPAGRREMTRKGPLVRSVVEEIIREGGQVVILGEGNENIRDQIVNIKNELSAAYPGQFEFINRFDSRRADLIFKGADFLLVPSKFEPCGLTQMMAMGFGTLPIVHNVGGLKDTVKDGLTGFVFKEYSKEELLKTVNKALRLFGEFKQLDRRKMTRNLTCLAGRQAQNDAKRRLRVGLVKMRQAAMREDFSWSKVIREYKKIYERVIGELGNKNLLRRTLIAAQLRTCFAEP